MTEIYDAAPDEIEKFVPDGAAGGVQDDVGPATLLSLLSRAPASSQRTTEAALGWYATHRTTATIGFNPNGMCLKLCRTARNIGFMFPSALAAQVATPKSKRITDLSKIRPGMVVYYDDPRDSNPYGHIVTVERVENGGKRLSDLLVWTNSVKSGEMVLVRGDYFPNYWGDAFQFASTWLNGQDLLFPAAPVKPVVKPVKNRELPRLKKARAILQQSRKAHAAAGNNRIAKALDRDIAELTETIKTYENRKVSLK